MNPRESDEPGRLLTMDEAAEWLGVTRNWVREKVAVRAIPHTRIGRNIRFTREHLDEIVAAGEQRPATRRSRSA